MRTLALIAILGILGSCTGPESTQILGDNLAVQLELPGLPAAVQQRLNGIGHTPDYRPQSQGELAIKIERITVDLSYTDAAGAPKSLGYVIPGYRLSENEAADPIYAEVQWNAETNAATISETTPFRIEGLPVDDSIAVAVNIYALEWEPVLLSGTTENVSTEIGVTTVVTVKLELSKDFDADGDGYVIPVLGGTDCNDEDPAIHEGQTEICDGVDQACNGPDDEESACTAACQNEGWSNMQQIPEGEGRVGFEDLEDTPSRKIFLLPFCMDKYEVKISQYSSCVENGFCTAAPVTAVAGIDGYATDVTNHSAYPVLGITQHQAADYCAWDNSKRLPTEFEWEIAARGYDGRNRTAPWGVPETPQTEDNTPAKVRDVHGLKPVPVNSFPDGKSPFGIRNLMGNAAEWTADFYLSTRVQDLPDDTNGLPPEAPSDVSAGVVVRGGGWDTPRVDALVFSRHAFPATTVNQEIGFRCVKSLP